ncbi:MAG: hypothetical protein JWM11_3213 [Planctomycetaceae bacterium]|nr:hypothetical protein [Planctomycetaceae bacterium]
MTTRREQLQTAITCTAISQSDVATASIPQRTDRRPVLRPERTRSPRPAWCQLDAQRPVGPLRPPGGQYAANRHRLPRGVRDWSKNAVNEGPHSKPNRHTFGDCNENPSRSRNCENRRCMADLPIPINANRSICGELANVTEQRKALSGHPITTCHF